MFEDDFCGLTNRNALGSVEAQLKPIGTAAKPETQDAGDAPLPLPRIDAIKPAPGDTPAPEGNLYSDEERKRVKDKYGENWGKMSWFDQQRALAHDRWFRDVDSGAIDTDTFLEGVFSDPEVERINKREQEFISALKNAMSQDVTRLSDDEAQGYYMDLVEADPRFGFKDDVDGKMLFGEEAQYGRANLKRLLSVYSGANPNGLYSREAQKWLESDEAQRIASAKEMRGVKDKVLGFFDTDAEIVASAEQKLMAKERAVQFATLMGGLSPAGQELVKEAIKADELDERTLRFLDEDERDAAMAAFRVSKADLDANWWLTQGAARFGETTASVVRGTWRTLANIYLTTGGRNPVGSKQLAAYEKEQELQLKIEDAEKWKYKDNLTFAGDIAAGLMGTIPYMAAMSNPYTGTMATLGMANDARERMILSGVDQDTALAISLPVGIVEGWIEKIQLEGAFGGSLSEFALRRASLLGVMKQIGKSPAKYLGGKLLKSGKETAIVSITEDVEEVLQQLTEDLGVSVGTGDFNVREIAEDCWDTAVESFPTTLGFGLMRASGVGPALHRKFSRKSVLANDFVEYAQAKVSALNVTEDLANGKTLSGQNGTQKPVVTAKVDPNGPDLPGGTAQDAPEAASTPSAEQTGKETPPTQEAPQESQDALKERLLDDFRTRWHRIDDPGDRLTMLQDSGLNTDQAAILDEFFRLEDDFYQDNPFFSYISNGVKQNVFSIENLPQVMKGVKKVSLNEDGTYTLDLQLDKDTVVPVKMERVDRSTLKANNRAQFEKQVKMNYEKKNGEGSWDKLDEDARLFWLGEATPGGFTRITVGDETIPFDAVIQLARPDAATGDGGAELDEVGHEIFHAATRIAKKMGILTDEDIEKMRQAFGAAKADGYLFDEETAADEYGKFLLRRTADSTGAFAKIREFFRRIYTALTRKGGNEPAELNAANVFEAIARGDLRGISALSGITVNEESATQEEQEVETPAESSTRNNPTVTAEVKDAVTVEATVEEVPVENLSTKNDPDFDPELAEAAPALVNSEPGDGMPVVVGGGNVLSGSETVQAAKRAGKKSVKVKRVRKVKTAKKPAAKVVKPFDIFNPQESLAAMNPFARNKFLSVQRFCDIHEGSFPCLQYWLDNGHAMFGRPAKDAKINDYLELLSKSDRLFLTGMRKGGTAWDELPSLIGLEDKTTEDICDQALQERAHYIAWKERGGLTPDEERLVDEHDRFIAEGHTEAEWAEANTQDETAEAPVAQEEPTAEEIEELAELGYYSIRDAVALLNDLVEADFIFGGATNDDIRRRYGIGSSAANGPDFVDLTPGDTYEMILDAVSDNIDRVSENKTLGISAKIGSKRNAGHLIGKMSAFWDENDEAHKYAVKNLFALFEKSNLGIVHHDKKGGPNDFIRVFTPFSFGGSQFAATITLRREKSGAKLYTVEAVEIENAEGSPRTSRRTAQGAQPSVSLRDRIAYYVGDVNSTNPSFIGKDADTPFSVDALESRVREELGVKPNAGEVQDGLFSVRKSKDGIYDPRWGVTKVRGGWTEEKIKREIKGGSLRGEDDAVRLIAEFDDVAEFKEHLYWHGSGNGIGGARLVPSIVKSKAWVERNGGGGYGQGYWGISVPKSKKRAANFGDQQSRGTTVYPIILAKGAKVIDGPQYQDAADVEDDIVKLWEQGVDAVRIGDWNAEFSEQELIVLNPRAICNIGNGEWYAWFDLGTERNPIKMRTDEFLKDALEYAKRYDGIPTFNRPKKPSAFEDVNGKLEFKDASKRRAEEDKYRAELDAWEKSPDYELYISAKQKRHEMTLFSVRSPHGAQKRSDLAYPDATPEISNIPDGLFSIGKRKREEFKNLIVRKRPDFKDPDGAVEEIGKFATPKEQKAALKWLIGGRLILPEDAPKVTEAIRYAEKAKKDPLQYDGPVELMNALAEFKPKDKPIDPDTVPQLSDKRVLPDGVVTYAVQDDRAGQQAMREIINTHWGKNANPWCLLHGDGEGNLSDGSDGGYDAWEYWNHYNALPKRVAFKSGKLVAFMATDGGRGELMAGDIARGAVPSTYEEWWDRQDSSHDGIPLGNMPVPNDPFGRYADFIIDKDGKRQVEGGYHKNDENVEIYWNENGVIDSYRDKKTDFRVRFKNGNVKSVTFREGSEFNEFFTFSAVFGGDGTDTIDIINMGGTVTFGNDGSFSYRADFSDYTFLCFNPDGTLDKTAENSWTEVWDANFEKKVDIETAAKRISKGVAKRVEQAKAAYQVALAVRDRYTVPVLASPTAVTPSEGQADAFSVRFDRKDPTDIIAGIVAMKTRKGEKMTINAVQKLLASVGADPSVGADLILRGQKSANRIENIVKGKALDDDTFLELATDESKKSRLLSFGEKMGMEGYKLGAADEQNLAALNEAKAAAVTAAMESAAGFSANAMELKYGFNLVDSVKNAHHAQVIKAKKPQDKQDQPGEVNGEGITLTEMVAQDEANAAKPEQVAAPESAAMKELKAKAAKRADKIDAKFGLTGLNGMSPAQVADAKYQEQLDEYRRQHPEEDAGGGAGEEAPVKKSQVKREQLDFNRASDFIAFAEEVVARESGKDGLFVKKNGAYQCSPLDVRNLANTAKFFLKKVASRLLYSKDRELIMRDLDELHKATTLRGVESAVMNLYTRILDRLIPESQEQLIHKLEWAGKQLAEQGPVLSRGGDERDRKVRARVEEWWRMVKAYLRFKPEEVEEEKNRLLGIIRKREEVQENEDGASPSFLEQDLKYRQAVDLLNALTQYGGLINRTPGEIADKSEEILGQLRGSRLELENAREDEYIRTRTISSHLQQAVINPKALKDNKKPNPNWFVRMMDSMMGILYLRLRDLIRYSHGDVRRRAESDLRDIEDAVALGSQDFNVYLVTHQRKFDEAMKHIYGSSEKGVIRLTEPLDDADRKVLTKQGIEQMTRSWLLQRFVELQQPDDYAQNIAVNKRDGKWREDFDRIFKKYISEQDMTFLMWVRNWYRSNLVELNDKVLVPVSGIKQYSPGENYFPVKMKLPTRHGVDAQAKAWSPLPSWLTPRVYNNYDFDERTDLLTMWYNRMRESGASIAYARLGLNLSDILLNPAMKDAVSRNHGDVALTRLQEHIRDIISGGARPIDESDDSLALADRLRAWQTNFTLSGNYISSLKQTTSSPTLALRHDIDFKMVFNFMMDVDFGSVKELMASDGWKSRYGNGLSESMQNAMRVNSSISTGRAAKAVNLLHRVYNSGFKVMEVGDAFPCLWVGQGLYRYFLAQIRDKEGGSAVMSEEEMKRKALTRTWAVIETNQQSKRTENLTAAQRGGPLGRFLYQFVSSPVQQMAFEVQAVREALAARGTDHQAEAYRHLGRVLVINHILTPGLLRVAAIVGGLPLGQIPNRDDLYWDFIIQMLMGQYGCIFLAGQIGEGTLRALTTGKFDYRSQGLPVEGIADLFQKLGVTGFDLVTWRHEELLDDLLGVMKSTGAPTRHISNAIDNWGRGKIERNLRTWR